MQVTGPVTAALPSGPDALFGDLFEAVQSRRIFADSKTFPDMEPRSSPSTIMHAWRACAPQTDDELRAFVTEHFDPPFVPSLAVDNRDLELGDYIAALWKRLVLHPDRHGDYSSGLPLPHASAIPGGRFGEVYYWDSYFTMLGLSHDGHQTLIEQMLDNFVSLIERYGHIPNGTRSYYLSRSQPPFFALMLGLGSPVNLEMRTRRLAALRTEYAYWMAGQELLTTTGANAHVVQLADGAILNRYWDEADSPRPESYAEDVTTAESSGRPANQIYRDIRAASESGWDFSSRWFADGRSMATIQTTALIPVDLNALLYLSEKHIAEECRALGDSAAAAFEAAAERRTTAIRRYCWDPDAQCFADWDWTRSCSTGHVTASTLFPLFAGLATPTQASAVAATVERELLAPGGLRTTTIKSGQQWDMPNGWAPLHWIAVAGLRRYGRDKLADTISDRWLATVDRHYRSERVMLEKYDVETGRPASGGEYPNQLGFGWTNAVTQLLLAERTSSQSNAAAQASAS